MVAGLLAEMGAWWLVTRGRNIWTTMPPVLAWAAVVVANLPSGNLAIAAGAVVGGGAWVALAWWSGGILAPLACHVVWTCLMIVTPVIREPERAT